MNQDDSDHLDGPAPSDTSYPQVAEDLRTLSGARNYHAWVFSTIEGALGRRIVEVGPGIGNYTPTRASVRRFHPDAALPGATAPRCHYFNAAAVPAWWVSNVVLKRQRLSPAQTRLFDRLLVPLAAALEQRVRVPFGLSLVVWIRRNR